MKKVIKILFLCTILTGCGTKPANVQVSQPATEYYEPVTETTTAYKSADKSQSKLDGLSVDEMLNLLSELEIENISSDSAIMVNSIFTDYDGYDKFIELLYWCGQGIYSSNGDDEIEKWVFTPNSQDIFSVDFEYKGAANIYTLYLNGISSISGNEVNFTKIKEDLSKISSNNNTGSRKISFKLNGIKYSYETSSSDSIANGMETDILNFINSILEEQNYTKKFYFINYNNIGCIIFYNTPTWAEEFKAKTGITLHDKF
jgi:hypothetical protein